MKKQIIISADFGRKAQEKKAIDALEITVRAWAQFFKNTHRKNKIEIVEM